MSLAPGLPERKVYRFDQVYDETEGWAKYNSAYWQRDFPDFLEFFFGRMFPEDHSTKQIEDAVRWGLSTDADAPSR